MDLSEIKDSSHGPCLIIGNGPSLNEIPAWFLNESYPTFACNFFTHHRPDILVDNLAMIDKFTIENENVWNSVPDTTRVLVFEKWLQFVQRPTHPQIVSWANRDDLIPGFTSGDIYGQYFPTTGHACVWLADVMGYDRFYLVGMDGTAQLREISGVDLEGRSEIPHFYNTEDKAQRQSKLWDISWGNMYRHMRYTRGKEIINLSTQTHITQLPRQDINEHIQTDPHSRMWSEHLERT